MTTFVLLIRHGEHEAVSSSPSPQRRLTEKGEKEAREVAKLLASVLKELEDDEDLSISIGAIWRAHTDEVLGTSNIVIQELGDLVTVQPKHAQNLEPSSFKPYKNLKKHESLVKDLKIELKTLEDGNAILVIGHQPLLGWMAFELLKKPVPIARSEILCIALKDDSLDGNSKCQLRWVLSPSDDKAIEELKEKIKSKMDIAKLLSAFITTALGFLLSSLIDQNKMNYICEYKWALYTSAGLFLAAVGLYLATMYAYDRLLMPTRFWGHKPLPENPEDRPKWLVWRPPSSALWVLYQNMMRIWYSLFTVATCSVLLGLFFMAYAVFKPAQPYWMIGIVAVGVIVFFVYYKHFGTKLGAQD
jgi:phosphohistidine phosphatase SixA